MSSSYMEERRKHFDANVTRWKVEARKAHSKRLTTAAFDIFIVAFYVGVISFSAVNAYNFYNGRIYPGDQAKDWLFRARATNDLRDMATYLGKAETILENYHGNPVWWFPTPLTDFDQIRMNVQEDIATATSLAASANLTSLAYQQAVQNLQETINEVADHLSSSLGSIWTNPSVNWLGWFLTLFYIFGWLIPIGLWQEIPSMPDPPYDPETGVPYKGGWKS